MISLCGKKSSEARDLLDLVKIKVQIMLVMIENINFTGK